MNSNTRTGFRIGEWKVQPQENLLVHPDREHHLEPRIMDLLVFLADRQGEVVSRDEILDSVWAGVIVGEETLSRAISLLRKGFEDDPNSPRYVETISKRGYRCIARVRPLESPTSMEGGASPATRAPIKRAGMAIAVLAVAGLLFAALFRFGEEGPKPTSRAGPSIAVLPFVNRSATEADQFFVDGIHDDLLSHIAKIGSIKTISATSVRQYRETTKAIPEIARDLGVATVLEGGVQRAGDQVRINVQLVDAETDEHLWAEIYDRRLTAANIFQIQSEIATEIARALEATLSPNEQGRINRIPTGNLAALEAYFLGKQSMERRTTAQLARAVDHFQEAIRLDPEFALAYVGLADTYRLQSSYADLPFAEANALGQVAVRRALEIDDQLAEAYTSLANLLRRMDDFSGAVDAFDRALELKPNYASAYQWYGEFLAIQVGRPKEALRYSTRAVELDPLSPIINTDHAEALDAAGRFDEALGFYRRAIDIDPGFAVAHFQVGTVFWQGFGRVDEAVFWYHRSMALDPGSPYIPAVLGLVYLELGDVDQAAHWIEIALAMAPERFLINSVMARLQLYRGDRAGAVKFAQAAVNLNAKAVYGLAILAADDLGAGRAVNAKARYESGFPELVGPEPVITALNYEAAVDFALVLSELGKTDRAELLRSRCMTYIGTKPRLGYRGYWVLDAKIHAQRGNLQLALTALEQAFDAGWRVYSWYYLYHDPSLEALRGEPKWRTVRDRWSTDMSNQRALVEGNPNVQAP